MEPTTNRKTYRERREARAARREAWAKSRLEKAHEAIDRAHAIADRNPGGEPIHVGTHSEGAARRNINAIHRLEEAAYREHLPMASKHELAAQTIRRELDRSIYSDDHDALEKLRERIAGLEQERERIKAYNLTARKGAPNPEILDERQREQLASHLRHGYYRPGDASFPSYALTNLSGNIKRNRDRLAKLENVNA